MAPLLPAQNLIAFDPGVTTGYCIAKYIGGREFLVIRAGQIAWEDRFAMIRNLLELREKPFDHVLVESFRLYRHKAQQLVNNDFPSSQLIGVIEFICWEHGSLYCVHQQPASVRQNVQILEHHRAFLIDQPHAQDAYRHIRYFVLTNAGSSREATETVSAEGNQPSAEGQSAGGA